MVRGLIAVAFMAVGGCGGGGSEPVPPAADYALSASPSAVIVNAGGIGHVGVSVSRTNFSGFVSLTIDAPPPGITATFNSGPTDKTWVTATISVEQSVSPGTYTLTIRGSASGVATIGSEATTGERVTSLTLTVAPAKPPTLFVHLYATPDTMVLGRGATLSSEIKMFSSLVSDVVFTVLAPPGITSQFATQERSGQYVRSMLSINVASTVHPGSYGVIVQGATSGVTRSMIVRVTVAAQSSFTLSAPVSVTVPQNTMNSVAIQINRTNFTGGVSFQLESALPAGMTLVLPDPQTDDDAGPVIKVLESVPLGTYSLTVRGSAPGYPDQRVTFQVIVTMLSRFTIRITPDRFHTYKGGTVSATITAERINWPHPITLSLAYLSDGLSGTLSETVLDGSTLSSTLTVNVPLDLPYTGGASAQLRAQSDTLQTITSVLIGISAAGTFFLSPSPAWLSIQQGASGVFNLSASGVSYFGPITVTFSGAPPGVVLSLPENPFGGDSIAVTVAVGAGVPPGNYRLTISGAGIGNVQMESTSVDLEVKAPGAT